MSTPRLSILLVSSLLLSCAADDDKLVNANGNVSGQDETDAGDGASTTGGTGNGGSTDTATNTGGEATGSSNPELCEKVSIGAFPREPDIMIVLDRSESMDHENTGLVPVKTMRWEPAVAAVKQVTTALQADVRFGLMVFPNEASGCAAGLLEVPMQLGAATAIAAKLDARVPGGATPISPTLVGARNELIMSRTLPDAVARDQYVLLITDGAPNCKGGNGQSDDSAASYKAVDDLLKKNIKTYVIGYDSGNLDVLSELAKRGGTGDTKHRNVTDAVTLVTELEKISRNVVPCTYGLEKPVMDARFVRVQVDGKSYPLGADGWQLKDSKSIELQPGVCSVLQDGKTHKIEIGVECDPVIVI